MADYDLRVLSLGAGVQSTAVYLMALEGELGTPPDLAIFADTGWEPPAIYEHLSRLEATGGDRIPIHRVSRGNLRDDVIGALDNAGVGHYGQPPLYVRNAANDGTSAADVGGTLWRKCTTDYKIEPIQKEIRRVLGYQPRQRVAKRAQQWFGISMDEAHRMRDSRVPWIDNHYPLIDLRMSRVDCLSWLQAHGWPKPRKSSCIGCPYHSNSMWAEMRDRYPEEWADAVQFDRTLRTGKLPGVTGDAYLHRRMMPLPDAVDSTHDPDQIDLFGNECEGLCGV